MRIGSRLLLAQAGLAISLAGWSSAWGITPDDNPYVAITNRNAFGIRPPPEPEPPPPVVAPPSAPPNIFLTGVSHQNGVKKAYFVINRPGGKQPEYETAREGEEIQDFKVLEINAKEGRVRATVNGREVSLNFSENGMKAVGGGAVPGAPGIPGRPPGVPLPAPIAPVPTANVGGGGSGPVLIGRGGVNLSAAQPANGGFNPALNYVNPSQPANNTAEASSAVGTPNAIQPTRPLPTRPGTSSFPPPQAQDQVQLQPVQGGQDPVGSSGIPIPVPPPSKYQ